MSTRIQEWLQAENTVVKSYEERRAEHAGTNGALDYNETVVKPWNEEHLMENEIRKQLGVPPTWASDQEKIEFHRRQLALLEKANQAPRCGHVYSDGTQCRAPRLRKDKVCYAHARMLAVRPKKLNLPPLEDANAVMLWLMEVSRALLECEITERTAGLLFYGLQMAMVTARWTTFAQTKPEEMVRSTPKSETTKTLNHRGHREHGGAQIAAIGAAASLRRRGGAEENRSEETQAGAPAVHTMNPGHPPHHANTARDGDPGHPPQQTKPGFAGDPGDGSAKSLCFGVERGEGDEPGRVQTEHIPDRTDREHL